MPLTITAYSPKSVAVWHHRRFNGDTVLDPDVHFYIHALPAEPDPRRWDWFPMSFEQTGVIYDPLFTLDSKWHPTAMDAGDNVRQFSLATFCNDLWLANLKPAGYTLPTV